MGPLALAIRHCGEYKAIETLLRSSDGPLGRCRDPTEPADNVPVQLMQEATQWRLLAAFSEDSMASWMRVADASAKRIASRVLRLQGPGDQLALVVPLRAFCAAPGSGLQCNIDSQYVPFVEDDDRMLILSGARIRESLPGLRAMLAGHDAGPQEAEWIALQPEAIEAAGLRTPAPEDYVGSQAGLLVISQPDGSQIALELRTLGSRVASRQLRKFSPRKKIPEGPDNLRRRESWFGGKSGRK